MKYLVQILLGVLFIYFVHNKRNISFESKSNEVLVERKVNPSTDPNQVDFYIRPIGDVSDEMLVESKKVLEDFYGYNCEIRRGINLTDEMKIENTDQIINAQATIRQLNGNTKTIFLVNKKLWYINKEVRGLTDGSTIVIRAKQSILRETLIHEVGHTLGLEHCDDLGCIMAINNDEYETGKFCKKCKNKLKTYE
jgi:predicted Zn-dependent protease